MWRFRLDLGVTVGVGRGGGSRNLIFKLRFFLRERGRCLPMAVPATNHAPSQNRKEQKEKGENKTNPHDPRQQRLDPRQQRLDPRQEALDPRQEGLDPRQEALECLCNNTHLS